MNRAVLALALSVAACSDDGESPVANATSTGVVDASSSTSSSGGGTSSGDESTTGTGTTSTGDVSSETTDGSSSTGADDCIPHQPWFYASFDDVPSGTSLDGFQPFDAASRTVATDSQAFAGSQSAQMEILPEDAGGFGRWGGIVRLPDVPEGESVWVRLWVRWPADFEFSAAPWMKFLRLHNRTASGDNGGYNDLYVDNADGPESVLRVIKEVHDIWEVYDGDPIPREQWERYEMQIVIDDVPVDDGGEARFRVWRDDALIFDRTDVPTVTAPGGTIDGLYIFTYWNNETPPHNVAFIDELAISIGEPPPLTDAAGLPVFGDWLPCR